MASESSSSSSSGTKMSWKYDVFLSFREEDHIRKEFIDLLYDALANRGFNVYKDNLALPRHKLSTPTLLRAIERSRFAVVVITKNYLASTLCFDELLKIMECKRETGQRVITVYHGEGVKNASIKKYYKSVIAKPRFHKIMVELRSLVDCRSLRYRPETIEEIVEIMSLALPSVKADVSRNLIGMEPRMQHVIKDLLKIGSGGVRMIGICGIGGGGKTTLATTVYNKITCEFGGRCSFVENLKENSRTYGLKKLQEKVLTDVFNVRDMTLTSIEEGKRMIKKRMRQSSALIVLDDVDSISQLEALAGSRFWFGEGSRIIITTRNKGLLEDHGVNLIHQVELFKDGEAIELFNSYAFPKKENEKLTLDVVRYAGDNPLALKVLGSFLCDKEEKEWTSALKDLKLASMDMSKMLRISYNGFNPDEKEMFLDIALFLRDRVKADVLEILDACGYNTSLIIDVLTDKSLIRVSNGHFKMDDLIQEMGHDIVLEVHPMKRSRILQSYELMKICSGHKYTKKEAIKGIRVGFDKERPIDFSDAFTDMTDLRFLDISISKTPKDRSDDTEPNVLPRNLRLLSWESYPGKYFPPDFQAKELVIMQMAYSKIVHLSEEHKLLGLLPKLKMLDLSDSKDLISIPSFVGFPNLERLILQNCHSLKVVDPSIGNLERLVVLDMSCCSKLKSFPPIVRMTSLEVLIFSGCTKLRKFPEIQGNIDSLKHLALHYSGIRDLPDTMGRISSLVSIDLSNCKSLKSLSFSFSGLKCLRSLKLSGCSKLEEIPASLGDLKRLEELLLDYTGITELPEFILNLKSLNTLSFNTL